MSSGVDFLNSEEAANVLGVNVSSIKRWTDEGKLECIRTLGGHRKFQMKHLANFVEKNKKKASKVSVFDIENSSDVELNYYILKGNFDYLKTYLIKMSLKSNRDSIQQVLTGLYLGQYPLYNIYDNLLVPVLHEIGERWMEGKLGVMEEHIASQIIRDAVIRLQGIVRVPKKKIGIAICLNLSNELHDIGLKMVQNIIELKGYKTYYTGQKTPFFNFEQIMTKIKPSRIYISSTYVENADQDQNELNRLYSLCERNSIEVYAGGTGFDILDHSHPAVVRRINNFEEVNRY
jgi:excisionase family DNA binding protein